MNRKMMIAAVMAVVLVAALCVCAFAMMKDARTELVPNDHPAAQEQAEQTQEQAEQTQEQAEQTQQLMDGGEEETMAQIYGLEGEIVELGEGYVVLSTAEHGMVQVNFTEDTVFEGVTAEGLTLGGYLFADYNGMMSRSIPAQVTGLRVYAVLLSGVVSEVADGSATILQDETGMEIVIHLPETAGQLAAGDHITAATNGAMTMSLPPQASAAQIAVNGK